ncbi:hypothetical protein [Streptomyces sp. NPDC050600]|uniref:hypothetical protein n=1 Tax=Streptomyces sp. NPDC050600 TaxID=3157213 RepID=UPI0034155F2C
MLDRSSSADLPPAVAHHLTTLAAQVWIAETTGAGRERWPDYFADPHLRAPYRDVRIQAAIARRARGQESRAVVRLVWEGTNSSGETKDSRTGMLSFEDHRNEWQPVR